MTMENEPALMSSSCPADPRPGSLVRYAGRIYKLMAYIGVNEAAVRPPAGGVETWVPVSEIEAVVTESD